MKNAIILLSLSMFLLTTSVFAQEKKTESRPSPISKENKTTDVISHNAFDAVLKKFVDAKGNVNYKALRKDRKALEYYVNELAKATLAGS